MRLLGNEATAVERRYRNRMHVEAEAEVGAVGIADDLRLQVAAGRGNYAHVRMQHTQAAHPPYPD